MGVRPLLVDPVGRFSPPWGSNRIESRPSSQYVSPLPVAQPSR